MSNGDEEEVEKEDKTDKKKTEEYKKVQDEKTTEEYKKVQDEKTSEENKKIVRDLLAQVGKVGKPGRKKLTEKVEEEKTVEKDKKAREEKTVEEEKTADAKPAMKKMRIDMMDDADF